MRHLILRIKSAVSGLLVWAFFIYVIGFLVAEAVYFFEYWDNASIYEMLTTVRPTRYNPFLWPWNLFH